MSDSRSLTIPPRPKQARGITLVELMVTIAVVSVLAAIAIPAYNAFVREGHFTAMRATMNSMRTSIEDFRLDNGSYGTNTTLIATSAANAIGTRYGWDPGTDIGSYRYTVVVVSTGNYNVWGQVGTGSPWVRCENRLTECCDSDAFADGTNPSAVNCP